ncbi:MAG: flavin reductase family protein [Burkholderiales bacterium]|nr:flavin reductase family protein [Burkholderiales bacterium]
MSDTPATPGNPEHDPRDFRNALGLFATGVTIVTTKTAAGEPIGLTANSFSSVSLSPPLVLWSLSLRSPNLPNFLQASHFAINVLAQDQIPLSRRFSQPVPNKFEGVAHGFGANGMPLIDGAAAQFECRTEARHYAGDHVIFIGHVLQYRYAERDALGYFRGRYAAIHTIDNL